MTKLEQFIIDNNLHIELIIKPNKVVVYIGAIGGLNLYLHEGQTINETIDVAIKDFMSRR